MILDICWEAIELFVLVQTALDPAVVLVVLLAGDNGAVEAAECVICAMHETSSARIDAHSL
jgi:hypothetical protein